MIEDEAATNSTPNMINALSRASFHSPHPVQPAFLQTVEQLVLVMSGEFVTTTPKYVYNWETGQYDPLVLDGDRTVVSTHKRTRAPIMQFIEIDRFLSRCTDDNKLYVRAVRTRKS